MGARETRARSLAELAERVGFEPTVPFGTRALQARAFDRSAISPGACGGEGGIRTLDLRQSHLLFAITYDPRTAASTQALVDKRSGTPVRFPRELVLTPRVETWLPRHFGAWSSLRPSFSVGRRPPDWTEQLERAQSAERGAILIPLTP